jgi:hypothetical protein
VQCFPGQLRNVQLVVGLPQLLVGIRPQQRHLRDVFLGDGAVPNVHFPHELPHLRDRLRPEQYGLQHVLVAADRLHNVLVELVLHRVRHGQQLRGDLSELLLRDRLRFERRQLQTVHDFPHCVHSVQFVDRLQRLQQRLYAERVGVCAVQHLPDWLHGLQLKDRLHELQLDGAVHAQKRGLRLSGRVRAERDDVHGLFQLADRLHDLFLD